jgi:branched-chain amino acid aminotransferase
MSVLASINGRVFPGHEAHVSVLDNGFMFGDGVYETLRTYDGRPFHLDRHLGRLRASAERIGIAIPLDDTALATRLGAVLAHADHGESYIRFVVTRGVGDVSYRFERVSGPTIVILIKPLERPPDACYTEGLAVAIVSVRRNHPLALDPAIKSINLLNNILAVREAQARGCAEGLLVNERGELAEGASSNVFVVRSGELLTPPLSAGILAGITRAVVLELAAELHVPAREQPLQTRDLIEADEAFISSSLRELAPIAAVDGRPVGGGGPGPITRRLLAAYRAQAPARCQALP